MNRDDHQELLGLLREIDECDSANLTEWELDFVASMIDARGGEGPEEFTTAQALRIREIHHERVEKKDRQPQDGDEL